MKIRAARIDDAAGIAKVQVESWKTTYRGIVSDSYLSSLSVSQREDRWQQILQNLGQHQVIYTAENLQGEVVGFAIGGPSRSQEYSYEGELYAIYLLEEYQGQGAGRSLFHAIVEFLRENGCGSMIIWALRDNPAGRFYEAMGGRPVGQKSIEIGGEEHIELAYGWESLIAL